MSWFGWLTKPRLEVTALDEVTFTLEALFLLGVLFLSAYWSAGLIDMYKDWQRSRAAPKLSRGKK